MQRRKTLGGEELRDFLKTINRLGYPPRPPPVSWKDPNESQESFADFYDEENSHQFQNETNQIPPGWESPKGLASRRSDAIA
jgi:hypothetical protein